MKKSNNLDYIMDENSKNSEENTQNLVENRNFCAACGRIISEGDHICSNCKAKLKQD